MNTQETEAFERCMEALERVSVGEMSCRQTANNLLQSAGHLQLAYPGDLPEVVQALTDAAELAETAGAGLTEVRAGLDRVARRAMRAALDGNS